MQVVFYEDDGVFFYFFYKDEIPQELDVSKNSEVGFRDSKVWTRARFLERYGKNLNLSWKFSENGCSKEHFRAQYLVINLTLCGAWAGPAFNHFVDPSGWAKCNEFVLSADRDGDEDFLRHAEMRINYLNVFDARTGASKLLSDRSTGEPVAHTPVFV